MLDFGVLEIGVRWLYSIRGRSYFIHGQLIRDVLVFMTFIDHVQICLGQLKC